MKRPGRIKVSGERFAYDHRHRHANDRGIPCEFVDAHQLLKDFFEETDKVLASEKGS